MSTNPPESGEPGPLSGHVRALLGRAGALARSPLVAGPTRSLCERLSKLAEALLAWPRLLAEADVHEAVALLAELAADLDYQLHAPLDQLLGAELAQAVADDPRLGWLAEALPPAVTDLREETLVVLAGRGIHRLVVASGAPATPGEVVPLDDQPVLTDDRELDGRVARIEPGHGGWRLADRVVVPARAALYHYRAADVVPGAQGQIKVSGKPLRTAFGDRPTSDPTAQS